MTTLRQRAVLATAVVCAATTMGTAAPAAAAGQDGPRPVVNSVEPVRAGQPAWVRVYWMTRRNICDARVTVSAARVGVVYPSNTGTYTSFRRDDTLTAGWSDYTAFRVTAAEGRTRIVKLRAVISYVDAGGKSEPCRGERRTRTFWVKLPVLGKVR